MVTKTKTIRSWRLTLAYALLVGLFAIPGVWLLYWAYLDEGWSDIIGWPIGAILTGTSILCLYRTLFQSSTSRCLACGALVEEVSSAFHSIDVIPCASCHRFLLVNENGTVELIAEDEVADVGVFKTLFPDNVTWPSGCMFCGNKVTQTCELLLEIPKQGAAVASVIGQAVALEIGGGFSCREDRQYRIDVPHCEAHRDGVVLINECGRPILGFRSLPRFRAFCKANELSPWRETAV